MVCRGVGALVGGGPCGWNVAGGFSLKISNIKQQDYSFLLTKANKTGNTTY